MQLRYVLLCMLSVFATLAAAANPNPEPDESKIPEWQVIRSLLFGDREINPDDKQVVRVYLNTRADDASTVPVMING
ncbi:MAG: hypothetical protein PVH05_08660, partial [Burkholderiales bacterium]